MNNGGKNTSRTLDHITVVLIVVGFLIHWIGYPAGAWILSVGFLLSAGVLLTRELKNNLGLDTPKTIRVLLLLSIIVWVIINFLFFQGGSLFFVLIVLAIYTALKKRDLKQKYERTSS
jgi:hypothetical protein